MVIYFINTSDDSPDSLPAVEEALEVTRKEKKDLIIFTFQVYPLETKLLGIYCSFEPETARKWTRLYPYCVLEMGLRIYETICSTSIIMLLTFSFKKTSIKQSLRLMLLSLHKNQTSQSVISGLEC